MSQFYENLYQTKKIGDEKICDYLEDSNCPKLKKNEKDLLDS